MMEFQLDESPDNICWFLTDVPLGSCEKEPEKITRDHTIIFFDWDDTLLCSSFLMDLNISLSTDSKIIYEHWVNLDLLSNSIIDILMSAKCLGEVVIVTNAEECWVQMSAQKFMPELIPILQTIPIISARTAYEESFPTNPYMWKYQAMKKFIDDKKFSPYCKKNIVSFGDSVIERESSRKVSKLFPNTISKSVKFTEKSEINVLKGQIDLLKSSIKYLVEYDGDLDLQMNVKMG
jgi:hypothetical protein